MRNVKLIACDEEDQFHMRSVTCFAAKGNRGFCKYISPSSFPRSNEDRYPFSPSAQNSGWNSRSFLHAAWVMVPPRSWCKYLRSWLWAFLKMLGLSFTWNQFLILGTNNLTVDQNFCRIQSPCLLHYNLMSLRLCGFMSWESVTPPPHSPATLLLTLKTTKANM